MNREVSADFSNFALFSHKDCFSPGMITGMRLCIGSISLFGAVVIMTKEASFFAAEYS